MKSKRGHRHGKGPVPGVGDYVQWTSDGVDRFNPLGRLANSGRHAWVDGSQTGIPISEVTVAEQPGQFWSLSSMRQPSLDPQTTRATTTGLASGDTSRSSANISRFGCQGNWKAQADAEQYEQISKLLQ